VVAEVDAVIKDGGVIFSKLTKIATGEAQTQSFELTEPYQRWYSKAHELVRQLLPSRIDDFENLYQPAKRDPKRPLDSYSVRDWLLGYRLDSRLAGKDSDITLVVMKVNTQLSILRSARERLDSSIFEIRTMLQADLFDSELDAARELWRNGFFRAAGAVAGVVLEHHLGQVCQNHAVTLTTKTPTLAVYNEALKAAGVIQLDTWRFIGFLADIRNLCDHKKSDDPTKEQVKDLLDGVDKVIKTVS
jgi:hypothetical protein